MFDNIQEAINYVNDKGGGTIFLKEGTYTLTDNITLYSNITLLGADADSTIIDANSTNNHIQVIGTSGVHKRNITIKNIKFQGWRDDVSYHHGILKMEYCDDCEISFCIFDDNQEDTGVFGDIYFVNCSRVFVEKNQFLNNSETGIAFSNCTHLVIRENTFKSNSVGIYTDTGTNITIAFNYFSGGEGIFFEEEGSYSIIVGNRFESPSGAAIITSYSEYVIIANNYIYHSNYTTDTGTGAIYIFSDDSGYPCQRITVANNIIWDCYNDGIYLSGGAVNECAIIGNVCTGNRGYGINIGSGSSRSSITGNQLRGNTLGGLNDNGTNTDVGHNIT